MMNNWIIVDTETGGLIPVLKNQLGDKIIDYAATEFDKSGNVVSSNLYKFVTPQEQALERNVSKELADIKYAPFNTPGLNLRPANKTYQEFVGQALTSLFSEKNYGKTVWVKNLNFESRFFSAAINRLPEDIKDTIFSHMEGFSEYGYLHGRIGVTSPDIILKKNLAQKAVFENNPIAAQQYLIDVMQETIATAGKTPTKIQVLDIDDISRGILALGQKQGLLTPTGDYFTGSGAEYLAKAFNLGEVAHGAYADTLQEHALIKKLIHISSKINDPNFQLEKFKQANPSLYEQFSVLNETISRAGKKYTTIKNYIGVLNDLVQEGRTSQIKTDIQEGIDKFITGSGDIFDIPFFSKTSQGTYFPQDVTRHFVAQGLNLNKEQIEYLEDLTIKGQNAQDIMFKRKISRELMEFGNKIDIAKKTAIQGVEVPISSIFDDVFKAATPKISKPTSNFRTLGIVGAGLGLGYLLFHGSYKKPQQENDPNVIFQEDIENLNAYSKFAKFFGAGPSKSGYSEQDIANMFYGSVYSDGQVQESEAAIEGAEIHEKYQKKYKRAGILKDAELATYDRVHNISGSIDWVAPDNRIADLKTASEERFKSISLAGKAYRKNVAQLQMYMQQSGMKEGGFLRYMNRENPEETVDIPVEYDPDAVRENILKINRARERAAKQISMEYTRREKMARKERQRIARSVHTKDSDPQQHYRY